MFSFAQLYFKGEKNLGVETQRILKNMETLARQEKTVPYNEAYCCKQENQLMHGCRRAVSDVTGRGHSS